MNTRIFNKAVLQSLRHSQYRYLSVQQQSFNKCRGTCHTLNIHSSKENHSSSFIFTKFSNDKTLCQSTLPIYTCFQRNLSVTSQLYIKTNPDPLKDVIDVAPSASEITESAATSVVASDVAENALVEYTLQLLMEMHVGSGLPWWATIALTAFLVRTTILLPCAIAQIRYLTKLEKVDIEIAEIDKKLKKESIKAQKKYGWPEHLADQKYEQAKDTAYWNLVKKENCHPMKTYFLISMQCITWMNMTAAIYTLCSNPDYVGETIVNQFTTGGFGWVKDLTQIDPYLVLPFSIGLMNLLLIEVHQAFKVVRRSRTEQWQCAFFRIVSIAMIPLAGYLPAAVNVYWLSSSTYGLLQAFLLNSSPVRRLFRVPVNDPGLKQPYRYFLKNAKERLRLGKGETALTTK